MAVRFSHETKALLERAYQEFHRESFRHLDPISLVHQYKSSEDKEVVAFLAAVLSYGNVKTILSSIQKVLKELGPSPYLRLLDSKHRFQLTHFRHRFTTGKDLEIIIHWLRSALTSFGSLEAFFLHGVVPAKTFSMRVALSSFVSRLSSGNLPVDLERHKLARERSLKYLLPNPDRGSACKRLNMYLRWMVRSNDGIDLGLWKSVSMKSLMLPVDTHLLQTLRELRWTHSKQATWRLVELATEILRLYSPEDPIRYDFALCHLSMSGQSIQSVVAPHNRVREKE